MTPGLEDRVHGRIEENKNVRTSAVKQLIVINRIKNKSLYLSNIYVCTVYIYYVYINTHTYGI